MLVSFNWLQEFVEIKQSPEDTAEMLTMGGLEIETLEHVGHGLDEVVTARIDEIRPHPTAANLSLVRINLGDSEATVVCGAPNIAVGQMVPYAGPGAVLPSGMEIREQEIKGVLSPGMICSEKELGLGEDASGILIFEDAVDPGMALNEAFPFIEDTILEVSITPNRGDCLSMLGIAREVAALSGVAWTKPQFSLVESSTSIHDRARIEVPDTDLCPRYVARLVEGLAIGPSPFDVRLRLVRAGQRPISNVVDATNLILMECGQPLHAFDFNLLKEGRIVVRRCDPGETFVTLDGTERKLPNNALMIRDGQRSVALAGIMGGLNSEIEAATTDVLIESACFEPFGIRRTAKALGMSTEASFRFERGVDPDGSLWAAHRAAYIIQKLAGGTILSGHIDVYPKPITRERVKLKVPKANSLIGIELTKSRMCEYLERLGIGVEQPTDTPDEIVAAPPSWRWDLERDVDLVEEVARVHGFQNVPVSTPSYVSAPDRTRDARNTVRGVANVMNAAGYTEIVSMSFVSRQVCSKFKFPFAEEGILELLNPLSEDLVVMRSSLIPGLLAAMQRNLNFRWEDLKLYEIGKTFVPIPGEELPRENVMLSGIAMGARYSDLWNSPRGEEVDFYDVKGALENVFEILGDPEVTFVPTAVPFLHPGKSANVVLDGQTVGYVGELSPSTMREIDVARKIQIFEILLEPLFIRSRKERSFRPLPRYPYIERDLSIVVERNCSGDKIKHLISRLGHDIISSVILFDLYRGESIPEGRQSLTFRIRYQSEDRTLTDEEVQEVHDRVVEALVAELGATLRD
jgi:phenylalanyl-tRNA synthetase beta chain